ncbi:MAG: Sec-independent protein translocase subunit TatA/TatB [Planctomycetota bacterium]|jgi:sec-independent protein translocase protein TatA
MTVTAPLSLMLAFGFPGTWEWLIILVVALVIFGRRLPEVGRSLGRGIVEFKRGIKGIEDDIDTESSQAPPARELPDESEQRRTRPPEPAGEPRREAEPASTAERSRDDDVA